MLIIQILYVETNILGRNEKIKFKKYIQLPIGG